MKDSQCRCLIIILYEHLVTVCMLKKNLVTPTFGAKLTVSLIFLMKSFVWLLQCTSFALHFLLPITLPRFDAKP